MNDVVSRDEYERLVEEVKALKTQLQFVFNLVQVNNSLITPEQQKVASEAVLSQFQDEAMHENNRRAFH